MKKAQTENLRKGIPFETGIAYSIACILPVLLSLFLVFFDSQSQAYRYLSYLLPQICFLIAIAVYFFRTKTPVKHVVCKKCHPKYFLIAVLLQFGLLSLSELNGLFLKFLSTFGYEQTETILPDLTGWRVVPVLLVIALLPSVMEETLFRGILVGDLRERGWGTLPVVLLSGGMFALFHTNPAQTAYQFCCGACFALVAMRSGSMLPTVLSHFLNNAVIIILASCGIYDFPSAVKLPLYLTAGLVLLGVVGYLAFLDKKEQPVRGMYEAKPFFFGSGVGIAVAFILWVSVLIGGIL